jgi:hypothetical protein
MGEFQRACEIEGEVTAFIIRWGALSQHGHSKRADLGWWVGHPRATKSIPGQAFDSARMHEGYGGAGAVRGSGLSSLRSTTTLTQFSCSVLASPHPPPPGPPSSSGFADSQRLAHPLHLALLTP